MFPTKVLVAIDGSPEATRAARMAAGLSQSLHSELHVVEVGDIPEVYGAPEWRTFDPGFQARLFEHAERETSERLEGHLREIREIDSEAASVHARVGPADVEIVRLAEEIHAGLVVLGSRGFGPLKRAVLGSVSSSVVRHAHCPVLVVRGGKAKDVSYSPGRILLAFDDSREASAASQAAIEIATGTGSELHILYVLPAVVHLPSVHRLPTGKSEVSLEQGRRGARSLVNKEAKRIEAEGGEVAGVHLAVGRPEEEIVELGENLDAGMIVMGSRGMGGMRRALMGSVSEFVVHYADRPVLVVRREEEVV
jgi:nucleotide-binding universal stress UspA family protein